MFSLIYLAFDVQYKMFAQYHLSDLYVHGNMGKSFGLLRRRKQCRNRMLF